MCYAYISKQAKQTTKGHPVKKVKFTPTANPAMAEAMRQIRASGAAGTHGDKRDRRSRTRAARRARALKDFA